MHPDHIPQKLGEEFEHLDDTLEADEKMITDLVTKEVPKRVKVIWNVVLTFRWFINCIFVAMPVSFFTLVANLMMFVYYLVFNKYWA